MLKLNVQICNGKGKINRNKWFVLNVGIIRKTGIYCLWKNLIPLQGSGLSDRKTCNKCNSEGRIQVKEIYAIINPGDNQNHIIKFEKMGEAGTKLSPSGDLYIKLITGTMNFILDIIEPSLYSRCRPFTAR